MSLDFNNFLDVLSGENQEDTNLPLNCEIGITNQQLYKISKILDKCAKASELIVRKDSFQHAFRYGKIVDYSEKGFNCTSAKAAKRFYEIEKDASSVPEFITELRNLISSLD